MQKGNDQLDDALLEFRRILFLDPTNDRARKNLQTIRERRGDNNRTVAIDAVELPSAATGKAQAARTGRSAAAQRPARHRARPHRRVPRWTYAAGGVGVVVLVAALWWNANRAPHASVTAPTRSPSLSSLSESPLLRDLSGEAAVPATTDSASVAQRAQEPAPGNAQPKPVAGDAAARTEDTAADVAARPNGVEPAPGVRDTTADRAVKKDAALAANTRPATKAGETQPGATASQTVTRPAAPVATGTLSVYFLGGVGEVLIDGKRFPHEPPFDGVSLPAGRHRIACRMSGDATPRAVDITIVPGRETVIEYEMGGEPVVSQGL
jgi:cytoskeletal protein RodZ